MEFKAINDSVIVDIPEATRETQRESGLFIIDSSQETNKTTVIGTIISVGEGKFDTKTGQLIPPPVKVGDKIVLSRSAGVELSKTRRMIRIDDIFALVV